MKINKDKAIFYLILLVELSVLPILLLLAEVKKRFSSSNTPLNSLKLRKAVYTKTVYVGLHEWGGYDLKREKTIKNGSTFTCGLYYQLLRYQRPQEKYNIDLTVTMSDSERCKDLDYINKNCTRLVKVPNEGMDFSGYAHFFDNIKSNDNSYVILTNSSVHCDDENFLDGYIDYMENNLDVGILGVSYCTKIVQTLVRNNFTPHLQSFFYLTTIEVLTQIIEKNNGIFPGNGITYKLLLIRNGEIRVSELVQSLGYNLAVVQENGEVYKWGKRKRFDIGYKNWTIAEGDVRQINRYPNKINKIKVIG